MISPIAFPRDFVKLLSEYSLFTGKSDANIADSVGLPRTLVRSLMIRKVSLDHALEMKSSEHTQQPTEKAGSKTETLSSCDRSIEDKIIEILSAKIIN